ncbi:Hypothetical protein NTJ_15739 [Nesidiocoris tenuis]|nr:Hypothetical protein NTJ_07033 [Nesidiocoris tenuis]BET02921.1 Hypothetical protein NTJ_15739 [Nesidiocoris tenuis]
MREVSAWFMKNKLVLNAEKSKLIHFRYTSLHLPKEIAVVIHRAECGGPSPCTCPVVRESESARYLGMTVDNRLTWGQHVDLLRSRLSRLVYGLRILKPMLDLEARIRLYQAIFLATLRYGIIHYGGTFVSVTRRLFSVLRLSQKIVGIQKGDQSGLIQGFEGLYYQASFMWVAKNLHRYTIDRQESSRLTRRGKYLRLALPRVDHDHGRVQSTYQLPEIFNKMLPYVTEEKEKFGDISIKKLNEKVKKYIINCERSNKPLP